MKVSVVFLSLFPFCAQAGLPDLIPPNAYVGGHSRIGVILPDANPGSRVRVDLFSIDIRHLPGLYETTYYADLLTLQTMAATAYLDGAVFDPALPPFTLESSLNLSGRVSYVYAYEDLDRDAIRKMNAPSSGYRSEAPVTVGPDLAGSYILRFKPLRSMTITFCRASPPSVPVICSAFRSYDAHLEATRHFGLIDFEGSVVTFTDQATLTLEQDLEQVYGSCFADANGNGRYDGPSEGRPAERSSYFAATGTGIPLPIPVSVSYLLPGGCTNAL